MDGAENKAPKEALFGRVKEVFNAALQLPEAEREPFLFTACSGDNELCREVRGLLRSYSETFLEGGNGPRFPTLPEPLPERLGSYDVVRVLGHGGAGIVYLALQNKPRRYVALKVLSAMRRSARNVERFEREAEILGQLEHPCIARVYESGTHDTPDGPVPFFAMEHVEGVPLSEYGRAVRELSERIKILIKICGAVQYAHERGVIHCDLKPANILVDRAGQPKVLDFGVARVLHASPHLALATSSEENVRGTLLYMSPEQVAGTLPLDVSSDVYSLGVLSYEFLSGFLPYELTAEGPGAVIDAIRLETPILMGERSRECRGELEQIVAKTLEKRKAERYRSPQNFADNLELFLAGEAPIVRRSPHLGTRRPLRESRGGLLVLLILVATVTLTYLCAFRPLLKKLRHHEAVAELRTIGLDVETLQEGIGVAARHVDVDCDRLYQLLGELTGLRTLRLDGVESLKAIEGLPSLPHLKVISLRGTEVEHVDRLTRFFGLVEVDLGLTNVADLSPLLALRNLRALYLDGTRVRDIGFIRDLRSLERLHLGGTMVTEIRALKDLVKIRELDLSYTQVEKIDSLVPLTNLKRVNLTGTRIKDLGPLGSRIGCELIPPAAATAQLVRPPGDEILKLLASQPREHGAMSRIYRTGSLRAGDAESEHIEHYVDPLRSEQRLIPHNAEPGDEFGRAVSLCEGTAAVSAPYAEEERGAVYILRRQGNVWVEEAHLTPERGLEGDQFGWAVSLDGRLLAAGAPISSDERCGRGCGAAYVFRFGDGKWVEEVRLSPRDGSQGNFGTAVSLRGDLLAVGAPGLAPRGGVFVFRREREAVWSQEALIVPEYEARRFGSSVSLNEDRLAIAALAGKTSAAPGSVALYERARDASPTRWDLSTVLRPPDNVPAFLRFGHSTALSGDHLLVGARGAPGAADVGFAHFYRKDGGVWRLRTQLEFPYQRETASSVGLDGDVAVLGGAGNPSYLCRYDGNSWVLEAAFRPQEHCSGERFGHAVAVEGQVVVAGSPRYAWRSSDASPLLREPDRGAVSLLEIRQQNREPQ